MTPKSQSWRPWALILTTAFLVGCASAGIEDSTRFVDDEDIAKPSVLLIYDFATEAARVDIDETGPDIGEDDSTAGERATLARKVSAALSASIVDELKKRKIDARRENPGVRTPLNALLMRGRFITVDQGDRTARVTVGFGAGSSELRVETEVSQVTSYGERRLASAELEADGSKMPGMAVPVGAGAAAGRAATSAAVSGTLAITREALGGLESDAGRLAEEIADRMHEVYERNGWL